MKKKFTIESPVEFVAKAALDNPNLGWMTFVLTDNKPNKNKQGIASTSFDNLIQSGHYMPVKVAPGGIKPDHSDAEPLGTIAQLETNEDKVVGQAALWKLFRPDDYKMLQEMSKAGDRIDVSWEISYSESSLDEDGVEWIEDPALTAATIVGNPAYDGRTQITSIASAEDDIEDKDELEEIVEEESTDDPVEEDESTDDVIEDEEQESDETEDLIKELEELRAYKAEQERAQREQEVLASRLSALTDAGVSLSDEEIEDNKDAWLSMTDDAFNTVVNLLKISQTSASDKTDVPDVSGDGSKNDVINKVRKGLMEMKKDK